jgi:hypothetical protein
MLALTGRDRGAFLLFSEERRRELLKANPSISFLEMTPLLEDEWENMTRNKQAIWRCMVEDDNEKDTKGETTGDDKKKGPAPSVAQSQESRKPAQASSSKTYQKKPGVAYDKTVTTPREHYMILTPGQRRAFNNQPPANRRLPQPTASTHEHKLSTKPTTEASYVDLPKLPRGSYPYDPVKPDMTTSQIDDAKREFEESLMYERAKPLPTTMNEKLAQSRRLEHEARRNGEELKWQAEGDWEHVGEVDYTDDPETMEGPDEVGDSAGQGSSKGKSVAGRLFTGGQRAVKWLKPAGQTRGEDGRKMESIAEDWLYEPNTRVNTRKHDPAVDGIQHGTERLEPESRDKNPLSRRRKTKLDTLKECVEVVGYGVSLVDKFATKKKL